MQLRQGQCTDISISIGKVISRQHNRQKLKTILLVLCQVFCPMKRWTVLWKDTFCLSKENRYRLKILVWKDRLPLCHTHKYFQVSYLTWKLLRTWSPPQTHLTDNSDCGSHRRVLSPSQGPSHIPAQTTLTFLPLQQRFGQKWPSRTLISVWRGFTIFGFSSAWPFSPANRHN